LFFSVTGNAPVFGATVNDPSAEEAWHCLGRPDGALCGKDHI